MKPKAERRTGLVWSVAAHVLFLVLLITGLPDFLTPETPLQPVVMTVDILPVSELSNVPDNPTPPSPKPQETPKPAEPKVEPKPEPKEEKEPVKPQPKTVQDKPKPEPLPEPKDEKKPTPQVEPKPNPEKTKEKPKPKDDLDAILKSVKDTAQKQDKKEDKKTESKQDASAQSRSKSDRYDATQPLSMSEMDMIRQQFMKCWNVPAGAKDAHTLVVTVSVVMLQDGSVQKAELAKDNARYASDGFFRAAADAAIRAVHMCSPLKNLPADKYERWKDLELVFDPKDALY